MPESSGQTAPYFSYGGIRLDDIKTLSFSQEPEYDESGVDYLYTHFTISLRAYLNVDLLPALIDEPVAQTLVRIRACLLRPQQQLLYFINADRLVVAPAVNTAVDAKNGPLPKSLNILQITPSTFIIEYTIECWLYECCPNSSDTAPYISNRWNETMSIDENMYTTRTRTGRMVFRADRLANVSPDSFRDIIVASCPQMTNFRRVQSDYTLTRDGLNIDYVIKDVEQYAMPPAPATKFEAEYRILCKLGAVYDSEVIVRVWGPRPTSFYTSAKGNMIRAAVALAATRIGWAPNQNPHFFNAAGNAAIRSVSLTEFMHENYIELKVAWMNQRPTRFFNALLPDNQNADGISRGAPQMIGTDTDGEPVVRWNTVVLDPPYIVGFGQQGWPGNVPQTGRFGAGSAGLMLLSNIIQDPCLAAEIQEPPVPPPPGNKTIGPPVQEIEPIPAPLDASGEDDPDRGTVTKSSITTVDQLPAYPTLFTPPGQGDSGQSSMWTDYILDIDYAMNYHTIQMPVASSSVGVASFATVAQPTWTKLVKWSAEKIGGQPKLPDYHSGDPNEVLLTAVVSPISPDVEGDAVSRIWRVNGQYTYGIVDPALAQIAGGNRPYLATTYQDTIIDKSNFVKGIASSGTSSTSPQLQQGLGPQ